ncbi:MAG: phytoene dehydrogenase [Chlamydiales bacterium 38-26]|nr:phytoene desaturase [Chlamydiales bacterium]OJV08108.1 MAG: phytoene dehydrogenase [Chlamydiales bacterium 38-26]
MTHSTEKQAICMGAGFGGMAAALRLKAMGYQVTLIDKMPLLGGRAQVFQKDGFSFDAGPTVITAPFLLEELFSLFSKKMENYLELMPLDLWYRYQFEDGFTLDYGKSLDNLLSQIRLLNPEDVAGYQKLLSFSDKIYQVGFERLASEPFLSLLSLLKTLPALVKLKSYTSVYQLVSSFIKNEKLRRAFTISPLLVGGNPFQTTSIYTLIHSLERKWGVHFPRGGTGALVSALKKLMVEEKITIHLKTSVKKIVVNQSHVKGVELSDGRIIPADLVVVNGDPAYVYKHMIDPIFRKKWTNQKIDGLSYSMGLFVLYFGTKKRYPKVAHHTIMLGHTYRELLDEIFRVGTLSEDISLYIHRPTATDPAMAPLECDSFYALAPVPNLRSGLNWDEIGPIYQEKLLSMIEDRLLPNLRENLVTSFYMTPKNFQQDYLSEHGAGFSIAPIFRQSAYFRFHNQSEDIRSLYFVGAGTHPGAGLPGVLSSAKVLEKILKEKKYDGN